MVIVEFHDGQTMPLFDATKSEAENDALAAAVGREGRRRVGEGQSGYARIRESAEDIGEQMKLAG